MTTGWAGSSPADALPARVLYWVFQKASLLISKGVKKMNSADTSPSMSTFRRKGFTIARRFAAMPHVNRICSPPYFFRMPSHSSAASTMSPSYYRLDVLRPLALANSPLTITIASRSATYGRRRRMRTTKAATAAFFSTSLPSAVL